MQTDNKPKLHTITDFELRDFIGVFPRALHPNYCQLLIDHFERVKLLGLTESRQEPGRNYASPMNKHDETYCMNMGPDMLDRGRPVEETVNVQDLHLAQEYARSISMCYDAYRDRYPGLTTVGKHSFTTTFKIQKTHPGQGYHIWHCETSNSLSALRVLLAIAYLNDVDEGGETEFLEQSVRVPARQGTVMICPAHFTHVHRGNPPLSNTKYILTTWISLQE